MWKISSTVRIFRTRSKDGVKALILIIEKIPDAMECLLDTAVSVEKYDINNVKCEIKLDFG